VTVLDRYEPLEAGKDRVVFGVTLLVTTTLYEYSRVEL